MASQLYIPDSNLPASAGGWWESPAIFVTDPAAMNALEKPVAPMVGQPCSVWAQVFNLGNAQVETPGVRFFAAPGSGQVKAGIQYLIGLGQYDGSLDPGSSGYIQLMETWIPSSEYGAHQCLIAAAYDPSQDDSLIQEIFASGAFDPPKYLEVAQKNLSVLSGVGFHHVKVVISGLPNIDKTVVLEVHTGGSLDPGSLNRLGLRGLSLGRAEHVEAWIGHEPHERPAEGPSGARSLPFTVQRDTTRLAHATIRAPRLGANEYQVVRIIERMGDRVLGGIGYVVVSDAESR